MKDYFEGQHVEWTDLYKDDRERMRPIIGAIILAASLAAIALYLLPKAFADHDPRDPDGLCFGNAQNIAGWTYFRDRGVSLEEAKKGLTLTEEELLKMPANLRGLAVKATEKGLSLVWEEKLPAEDTYVRFYEWCVNGLQQGSGA